MKPRLRRLAVAAGVALLTMAVSGSAAAANGACKKVKGRYSSMPTPCAGFCTSGELSGAMAGSYEYTTAEFIAGGDFAPPGVMFYTGASVITLRSGGTLVGTDAGTLDMGVTGKQAALITIEGGTGEMTGASGYLQLLGGLNPQTGEVTGEFKGEICVP